MEGGDEAHQTQDRERLHPVRDADEAALEEGVEKLAALHQTDEGSDEEEPSAIPLDEAREGSRWYCRASQFTERTLSIFARVSSTDSSTSGTTARTGTAS